MNISLQQQRLAILLPHFATNFVFLKVKLAREKITTNSQDERTAGFEVTSLKSVTYSVHMVFVLMQQCLQRAYHESATKERY